MEDGIATIPVHGTLSKRMNMFSALSGGASYEMLGKTLRMALADPGVEGILLDIDSPGGGIDGMVDFGNLLFESRGEKPIFAYADGLCASAAYITGSAADKVFAANETTHVGSIGVIALHLDYSKQLNERGVTPTVFSSGKYKAIGNRFEPLTTEGREYKQAQLDYVYSLAVNDVARNRGVSSAVAGKDMAEGKMFIGAQAKDAGLVDGIMTREQVVAKLKGMSSKSNTIQTRSQAMLHSYTLPEVNSAARQAETVDQLKELRDDVLVHCEDEKKAAPNWIEEKKWDSLAAQTRRLVDIRRRQVLSQPRAKREREEYLLGRAVGAKE